jgi:hypothetical protein
MRSFEGQTRCGWLFVISQKATGAKLGITYLGVTAFDSGLRFDEFAVSRPNDEKHEFKTRGVVSEGTGAKAFMPSYRWACRPTLSFGMSFFIKFGWRGIVRT